MHQVEAVAQERPGSSVEPIVVENVLRHAFRRAVLLRDGKRNPEIAQGALACLDALLARTRIATADRVRLRTLTAEAARAFPASKLGRRLFALPAERVSAASDDALDLLVSDRRGRCYGVRFAIGPQPSAIVELASRAMLSSPGLSGIVVYDLERHGARRIDFNK